MPMDTDKRKKKKTNKTPASNKSLPSLVRESGKKPKKTENF